MDLDARPYRAFVTVADTLSFSRAAELLHTSQPALSAQVREFERRLGFALFTRTSRRVALTTEGRLFLDRARRLVTETEWANTAAREIRSNRLRIGAAHHTAAIPERNALIDGFMLAAPDVPLRVLRRSPAQLRDDLAHARVDAAVLLDVATPDAASPIPPGCERWTTGEREARLWVPHGHALASAPTVAPGALKGVEVGMIDRSHGVAVAEAIGRALVVAGASPFGLPEGDAESVARQCRLLGRCAVDLGWFGEVPGMIALPVADWDVRIALVVAAPAHHRREGAARFLASLGG